LSDPRAPRLVGHSRDRRGGGVSADLETAARPRRPQYPLPRVGAIVIDADTVAQITQTLAARASFDPGQLGGHSLKRGALSTGMARGCHPTRLKQLGRHRSYAVLDVYLELGDPFESHPLNGGL
jgi:hypothetical protein